MVDRFGETIAGTTQPASKAIAITPDDNTDLSEVVRSIYIGVAGNVAVITKENDSVTFVGLIGGQLLPVRISRVKATGTTATNLIGLI